LDIRHVLSTGSLSFEKHVKTRKKEKSIETSKNQIIVIIIHTLSRTEAQPHRTCLEGQKLTLDSTHVVCLDWCAASRAHRHTHCHPASLEPPAWPMFAGIFCSSSRSRPYQKISRNTVSVIYTHWNHIKPLNNLFLPNSDLGSEATGVNCVCR
jgi:hypothetical protein